MDVIVLGETDSTQDAARRLAAPIGTVVLAGRQYAGRGRLGSQWADTADDGLAMTAVVASGQSERLAIVAAVAVAEAAESLGVDRAMIKWPNDVYVDDRKLAGVLIERDEARSLVGIGMNINQQRWPEDLHDKAISLAQIGLDVDRADVAAVVLQAFNRVAELSESELTREFIRRDRLTGRRAVIECRGEQHDGIVRAVDPLSVLEIEVDGRRRRLPASHSHIISFE